MNHSYRFFIFIFIFFITTPDMASQVEFKIPIFFQGAGASDTSRLWIGVCGDGVGGTILDNTYGRDVDAAFGSYGSWRESISPQPPLGGWNFWTQFIDVPGRHEIEYETGLGISPYDFRGFSNYQQIDTFCIQIKGNHLSNGPLTISWSYNDIRLFGSWWELKKKQGSNWSLACEMVNTSSYTESNVTDSTLTYLIIKRGAASNCRTMDRWDINWGNVAVGTSVQQTVTICNTCVSTNIIIYGVNTPTGFTVEPNSITIGPQQCVTFTVTFSPTSEANYSDLISFATSEGYSVLPVIGYGYVAQPNFTLNNNSLNFGNVLIGGSSTQNFTVTNTGTSELSIASVTSIEGYTVEPNPPSSYPIPIAPGTSKTFNVTFAPTSVGYAAGNIIITHNASGGISNLSVMGQGVVILDQQFKVPIVLSANLLPDTLWLGVSGDGPGGSILDNTYGLDDAVEYGAYGQWREIMASPPPLVAFRSMFKNIPNRTQIPYGLRPYDFRGYTSSSQIDTFAIWTKQHNYPAPPPAGPITISWPSNLSLYGGIWELKKKVDAMYFTIVNNMSADGTSYIDPNTAQNYDNEYLLIRSAAPLITPGPNFILNKSSLDFGNVSIGRTITETVTVVNTGVTNTLMITGTTSIAGITITPDPALSYPIAVEHGLYQNFAITFSSSMIDTIEGDIVFTHNASGGTTNFPVHGISSLSNTLFLNAGWNLVSIPRVQTNDSAAIVFPCAYGSLSKYDPVLGDYVETPSIALGIGVWVYYSEATAVVIAGAAPAPITIACKAGWNLIGSRETELQVSNLQLSAGSIYGSAFRYNTSIGDYAETTGLIPGEGIWVYVTEDCELTIP